jgi:hypothetical protein
MPNPMMPQQGVPQQQPAAPNMDQMVEQIVSQIPPQVLQQIQQMPPEKMLMLFIQLLKQSMPGLADDMAQGLAEKIVARLSGQGQAPMDSQMGAAPLPSLADQGV